MKEIRGESDSMIKNKIKDINEEKLKLRQELKDSHVLKISMAIFLNIYIIYIFW